MKNEIIINLCSKVKQEMTHEQMLRSIADIIEASPIVITSQNNFYRVNEILVEDSCIKIHVTKEPKTITFGTLTNK